MFIAHSSQPPPNWSSMYEKTETKFHVASRWVESKAKEAIQSSWVFLSFNNTRLSLWKRGDKGSCKCHSSWQSHRLLAAPVVATAGRRGTPTAMLVRCNTDCPWSLPRPTSCSTNWSRSTKENTVHIFAQEYLPTGRTYMLSPIYDMQGRHTIPKKNY